MVLIYVPLNQIPQLSAFYHGTLVLEDGTTAQVSGGAPWLAQAQAGGTIGPDQATVQWTANENYSATHAAVSGGIITAPTLQIIPTLAA